MMRSLTNVRYAAALVTAQAGPAVTSAMPNTNATVYSSATCSTVPKTAQGVPDMTDFLAGLQVLSHALEPLLRLSRRLFGKIRCQAPAWHNWPVSIYVSELAVQCVCLKVRWLPRIVFRLISWRPRK